MNATEMAEANLQNYKSIVYQNQDKKSIFNLYKIDYIKIYKEIVIKYNLNIAETILYFYMASQDEKTWNYNKKELCNTLNWGLTKTKKTLKSLIEKGLIIKIKGIKKYKVIREYSKNFVMIPTDVIKDKRLCDGVKEVYIYMASQSTEKGKERIYSIADITKELKRDKHAIIKYIKELKKYKWIESNEKRNREKGIYRINNYKVIYFKGWENETYKEYKTRINQDQNSTSPSGEKRPFNEVHQVGKSDQNSTSPSGEKRPKPSGEKRPKPSGEKRPLNYIYSNYKDFNYKNSNCSSNININIVCESENEKREETTTRVVKISEEEKTRANKRAEQILKECQEINKTAYYKFKFKNVNEVVTPHNTRLEPTELNELKKELAEQIKKPVYDFEKCITKAREEIANHSNNDFILKDYLINLVRLLKHGEGKNIRLEPTEEERAEQQAIIKQKQKDKANQEAREKAEKEREEQEYKNLIAKHDINDDEYASIKIKATMLKMSEPFRTEQECFEIELAKYKDRLKATEKFFQKMAEDNLKNIFIKKTIS